MDDPETPTQDGLLACPTPISAHRPLIAHRITSSVCETRQGESYHKCFSCVNSRLQNAREREIFREKTALGIEPAPILHGPGSPVRETPLEREAPLPVGFREEPARALPRF